MNNYDPFADIPVTNAKANISLNNAKANIPVNNNTGATSYDPFADIPTKQSFFDPMREQTQQLQQKGIDNPNYLQGA